MQGGGDVDDAAAPAETPGPRNRNPCQEALTNHQDGVKGGRFASEHPLRRLDGRPRRGQRDQPDPLRDVRARGAGSGFRAASGGRRCPGGDCGTDRAGSAPTACRVPRLSIGEDPRPTPCVRATSECRQGSQLAACARDRSDQEDRRGHPASRRLTSRQPRHPTGTRPAGGSWSRADRVILATTCPGLDLLMTRAQPHRTVRPDR